MAMRTHTIVEMEVEEDGYQFVTLESDDFILTVSTKMLVHDMRVQGLLSLLA